MPSRRPPPSRRLAAAPSSSPATSPTRPVPRRWWPPHLIERGRGAIVNVSSTAGLRGAATRAHYSASKFAVIGFSQSLALEVAKSGIRVNCVAPASVRSAMTVSELMAVTGLEDREQADALWTEVAAKRLPFGRSVEPEDIGRAVVFLCAAEMISGVVLPVTGGEDLRR